MSDLHKPYLAVTATRASLTLASASLPQQQQTQQTHMPTQTPVDPRPRASAPAPPRQSPDSATLSAIATLPAPPRALASMPSSSATTLGSIPSSSSGSMSSTGSSAYTSSPSNSSSACTSSPSNSLQSQPQPSRSTPQVNPRSASGSLNRFANRPVSQSILQQESSPGLERGDVANATFSGCASQPLHETGRSPKPLSASQPLQRIVAPTGLQSSMEAPFHIQNKSVSHSHSTHASTLQSPRSNAVPALPSASNGVKGSPQQTPNASDVLPTQSPRMIARTTSSQGLRTPSQAEIASATYSPLRPASPNGHESPKQPPRVPPVPNVNPTDLASPQVARSLSLQSPRGIQVVALTKTIAEPEQPLAQPATNSHVLQTRMPVGPPDIFDPSSQVAAQPVIPLDGSSSLDASEQTTTNPVQENAAPSSDSKKSLARTSPPAASSPNNAVDPKLLLGLRGSFLTSSEPVDYESLVSDTENFKPISFISCLEISVEELEEHIISIVEQQGEPLVISDLDKCPAWTSDLFSPQKYESLQPGVEADGHTVLLRNLTDWTDQALPLHAFMARCVSQRTYPPEQLEKLYGKDLPCPQEWSQALVKLVHPRLGYHGEQDASASLRDRARSVTQMCYYGPGQTCTPLHRDLCSSLGQNLMVWSDPEASAMWMITHPEDADAVDRYIETKGGDPYSEGYAPHPNELRDAPFPVSCWKQRVGDLVLIPARASHMVINLGGRTLKAAWSRLTIDTLGSALLNDLPLYQRMCRVETYHIKPVIEEMLLAYTGQVEADFAKSHEISTVSIRDLRALLKMYDAILSDVFVPDWREIKLEGGYDSYVECDFCGADVWHGYFECQEGETLCALCYCQGRLCGCSNALEALQPRQHWRSFGERLQFRNKAAQVLLSADPSLALPINERANASDDEAEDEPPLLPVQVLEEDDVGKGSWPFSFMAAMNLYKLRQTAGWQGNLAPCKICNANVDLSQRYHCKPCNQSFCHGCLLHKLYIHPAHTLAQNEPKPFHGYHKKLSTLDYKEWKQDPLEFCEEARAHFALIEAARTKMKCRPINESCRIGFLDITDKHPHGLTGTLGVRRPPKTKVHKARTTTEPASSSPPSTPSSRKRPKDTVEPASAASPRSRANKKAKLDSPTSKPMDQDDIVIQVPRTPEAIESPASRPVPVPVPLPRPALPGNLAVDTGESQGTEQATSSIPTVASGIRKFVLREGKVRPVPPVLIAPAASEATPSKPAMANSSSTSVPIHPTTPKAVRATPPVLARSASNASSPNPSIVATNPRPNTSDSPPVLPNPNGGFTPESGSEPVAQRVLLTAAVPVASPAGVHAVPPASSTPRNVSPPSAAAAPVEEQGTLALATSVVAAGISSSPKAPAAGSSPDTSAAGLGALDSMNLRVITEILRIFSQSNQRMIQSQVEEINTALAKQAEEHKRQQAKQDDYHRKALAKMEATLLKRFDEQSAQMMSERGKHKEEIKELRQKLDEVVQQQNEIVQRQSSDGVMVGKLYEKISGLLHDIDQQAQAQLQAELATRTSQSSGSDQAMPSAHFAPTSHTR